MKWKTLATFQAARRCHLLDPGHRPPASALGSVLPARWAGWAGDDGFAQPRPRPLGLPSDAFELRRKEAAIREPVLVQAPDQILASLFLLLGVTLQDPRLEQLGQLLLRVLGWKMLIRWQIQ
jgi:hypothetical protein